MTNPVEDASELKPIRKPLKDVSNKKKSAINKTAQKNTHSDDDYSLDRLLLVKSAISYSSPGIASIWNLSDFNEGSAPTFGLRVLELKKRNEDDAMAMANVSTLFYNVATHFGQTQKL